MKEVLEQLKELMGDSFEQLLEVYINDTRKRLESIHACIVQGDVNSVKSLAHTIKGSSRNMGAMELADLCEQCEKIYLDADTTELFMLHEQACSIFSLICVEIDQVREVSD